MWEAHGGHPDLDNLRKLPVEIREIIEREALVENTEYNGLNENH